MDEWTRAPAGRCKEVHLHPCTWILLLKIFLMTPYQGYNKKKNQYDVWITSYGEGRVVDIIIKMIVIHSIKNRCSPYFQPLDSRLAFGFAPPAKNPAGAPVSNRAVQL